MASQRLVCRWRGRTLEQDPFHMWPNSVMTHTESYVRQDLLDISPALLPLLLPLAPSGSLAHSLPRSPPFSLSLSLALSCSPLPAGVPADTSHTCKFAAPWSCCCVLHIPACSKVLVWAQYGPGSFSVTIDQQLQPLHRRASKIWSSSKSQHKVRLARQA